MRKLLGILNLYSTIAHVITLSFFDQNPGMTSAYKDVYFRAHSLINDGQSTNLNIERQINLPNIQWFETPALRKMEILYQLLKRKAAGYRSRKSRSGVNASILNWYKEHNVALIKTTDGSTIDTPVESLSALPLFSRELGDPSNLLEEFRSMRLLSKWKERWGWARALKR